MNILKSLLFVSILFTSSTLFTSCKKKQSKNKTTVNFYLHNPITGEIFSGVKVKILMKEEKSSGPFVIGNSYKSSILWEGVTDMNGKASYSFNAYSNNKYQYWQVVDESFLNTNDPIIQPAYESLNKDQTNIIEYQLTKKVNFIRWIKNINYFDANDKFSYRLKGIVYPWEKWGAWSPYGTLTENPVNYFEGLTNFQTETITENQNVWQIEMVTIRNGITTTKVDTFYLTGTVAVDTMKLFY